MRNFWKYTVLAAVGAAMGLGARGALAAQKAPRLAPENPQGQTARAPGAPLSSIQAAYGIEEIKPLPIGFAVKGHHNGKPYQYVMAAPLDSSGVPHRIADLDFITYDNVKLHEIQGRRLGIMAYPSTPGQPDRRQLAVQTPNGVTFLRAEVGQDGRLVNFVRHGRNAVSPDAAKGVINLMNEAAEFREALSGALAPYLATLSNGRVRPVTDPTVINSMQILAQVLYDITAAAGHPLPAFTELLKSCDTPVTVQPAPRGATGFGIYSAPVPFSRRGPP